jgi:hypothetical protein
MIELDFNEINSIELIELSELIINEEHKGYFLGDSGKEHYKLISFFSTLFNDCNLLDIGTYKGNSSLAMSYNIRNHVHSFDIENHLELKQHPDNINFYLDDVMKNKYQDLILSSPFILVDTFHDGSFETQFHTYLTRIGYQGYLMLDDIKLNSDMISYWNSIQEEKYDVSQFGHWSGTGLVIFK